MTEHMQRAYCNAWHIESMSKVLSYYMQYSYGDSRMYTSLLASSILTGTHCGDGTLLANDVFL